MLTCAGRRPRSSTRARCRRPPPRSSGASPASTAARPCPRPAAGAAASSPARARGTAANVRRLNKTIVTLSQQQQTIFLAPNTSQNMQKKTLVRFLLVTQYSLPLFGKRHKTLLFPTLSAQLGRKQLLMEKLTWLWFQRMGSRTCRENQGMIGLMVNVSRKLK